LNIVLVSPTGRARQMPKPKSHGGGGVPQEGWEKKNPPHPEGQGLCAIRTGNRSEREKTRRTGGELGISSSQTRTIQKMAWKSETKERSDKKPNNGLKIGEEYVQMASRPIFSGGGKIKKKPMEGRQKLKQMRTMFTPRSGERQEPKGGGKFMCIRGTSASTG